MIGPVDGSGKIEVIIPHRVSAGPCHILSETALDNRRRGWSGRRIAGDEGIAPGGSGVPYIFKRRIVIQSDSENPVFAVLLHLAGIADVGVIHPEVIVLRIVGDLQETTQMVRPGAGQEQRNILGKLETVALRTGLCLVGAGIGHFKPCAQRKVLKHFELRAPLVAWRNRNGAVLLFVRIAEKLEQPTRLVELRGSGVAAIACQSSLPGVAG